MSKKPETENAVVEKASAAPQPSEEMMKRLQELEAENARLKADAGAKEKAKVETKLVSVVSAKPRNYLVDGVQVTQDKPVKLERREGNYLDCQMKAGLIVEYEG